MLRRSNFGWVRPIRSHLRFVLHLPGLDCAAGLFGLMACRPEAYDGRRGMKKIFVGWLAIFLLYASVQAADKIRIGFPDFSSPFLSLPLGQKQGFFQQEGIQAEFIRIRSTVALTALV